MKKKVVVFADYFQPGYLGGGPIKSLAAFVENFGADYDIVVVTRDRDLGGTDPYSGQAKLQTEARLGCRILYVGNFLQYLRALWTVKKINADLVYLNSFFSFQFSILPIFLSRIGLSLGRHALVAPRGEFGSGALASSGRYKKLIYFKILKHFQFYRAVYFQASQVAEKADIQDHLAGLRIESAEVMIASDLVPALRVGSEQKLAVPDSIRATFVGRIHPVKGLKELLAAIQSLDVKLNLRVVGPIENAFRDYATECQHLADLAPANVSIRFDGPQAPEAVQDILSETDLFVSLTHGENFGHSIFEALQMGIPVLITDKTPFSAVQARGCGIVLSDASKETVSAAIKHFSNIPSEQRLAMSRAAREFAKDKLSEVNDLKAYRDMFSKIFSR